MLLDENNYVIKNILDCLENQSNVFLTGPAGVGKSTIITSLIEFLRNKGLNVAATATTGVAAININGITINKFLGFNVQTNKSSIKNLKNNFYIWAAKAKIVNKIDIIVIDEISMLSSDQFELIDYILREYTKLDIPFGGVKMIFVGDFLQLPAVTNSANPWAFQSPSWANGNIANIVLNDVIRQGSNRLLIDSLCYIRKGIFNDQVKWLFNQIEKPCDQTMKDSIPNLVSLNAEADLINTNSLSKIDEEPVTYIAKISGNATNYKLQIEKSVVAKKELILKKHARVMSIYNDQEGLYVNGSIGTVISLNNKWVKVRFDNGNTVVIERQVWTITNFDGKILSTFKQIPLILAYAVTIHKSQGSTLDSLFIDCSNIFACGQLYTALSRCTNLEGIYTKNISRSAIITSKEALNFVLSIENK